MATYKGNAGNLMQHWTLCELLTIAGRHALELSFLDAHAMAPYAHKRTGADDRFDRVRAGLPGQSIYEQAWYSLAQQRGDGYPNSAAFVREIWKGHSSLLLCEADGPTADEIDSWLNGSPELFRGDWRERFRMGLPDAPLTLISFDPNMYDRHGPPKTPKPENMYPRDLYAVVDAVSGVSGGVLMQLSTYSANHANAQKDVCSSVNSILEEGRFTLAAVAPANGNMMSLVYSRNVAWSNELANLPGRFEEWLSTF